MVSRRGLLYGSTAALIAPRPAGTQPTGKSYRIGFLRNGRPADTFVGGLRQGLREAGYIEGQNLSIEYALARSASALPSVAVQLVTLKVDVILASGTPPVPASPSLLARADQLIE